MWTGRFDSGRILGGMLCRRIGWRHSGKSPEDRKYM